MSLTITGPELTMIDYLQSALSAADQAGDNYHALENGGTYGEIKTLLIGTITKCLALSGECEFPRPIAELLYNEMLVSGISCSAALEYFNKGQITF